MAKDEQKRQDVIDIAELQTMKISALMALAKELGITNLSGMKKQELIMKVVEEKRKVQAKEKEESPDAGLIASGGVLELLPDGYGFLPNRSGA